MLRVRRIGMNEVIYFDANPTVRRLVSRSMEELGLHVVDVKEIAECEDVLKLCPAPALLILDLSRQPEVLPELQKIVPQYLSDSERCIVTSVMPTALAPFLPQKIDECFFKHVVERPFKKNDFLELVRSILFKTPASSISAIHSNVSQITSNCETENSAFKNRSIPEESTIEESTIKDKESEIDGTSATSRMENRIARSGRMHAVPERMAGAGCRMLPEKPVSVFKKRITRENAIRKNVEHSNDGNFRHTDVFFAPADKSESSENARLSPVQCMPNELTAVCSENINAPAIKNAGMAISQTLERTFPGMSNFGEMEVHFESTGSTSQSGLADEAVADAVANAAHPSAHAPSEIQETNIEAIPACPLVPQTEYLLSPAGESGSTSKPPALPVKITGRREETKGLPADQIPTACRKVRNASERPLIVCSDFQLTWLIRVLQESTLQRKKYTVAVGSQGNEQLLFLEGARGFWFEPMVHGGFPEVADYIRQIPDMPGVSKEELLKRVQEQDMPLSLAFKSLNAEAAAGQLCLQRLSDGMERLSGQLGTVCRLYEGIPEAWACIVRMRPCKFIAMAPILFEMFRKNEDTVLRPAIFSKASFVTRNFRTPFNAHIRLNDEELALLSSIQSPATLQTLRQSGKKHAGDVLFRLLYFEFCDLAS